MSTRRVQKVASLIKRRISEMVKESIPEEKGIVSVTEVILTPDFKNAEIYISCLDKSQEKDVFTLLEEKKFRFQQELGKQLILRYTPRLTFKRDSGFDDVDKIEELLHKLS